MEPTMKQYEVTRAIAAASDEIWALLTNAPAYPDWNPAVVGIEAPSLPVRRSS
jgi:ribosome-associated toxin RatA of RatAB toxin-antitoxin module